MLARAYICENVHIGGSQKVIPGIFQNHFPCYFSRWGSQSTWISPVQQYSEPEPQNSFLYLPVLEAQTHAVTFALFTLFLRLELISCTCSPASLITEPSPWPRWSSFSRKGFKITSEMCKNYSKYQMMME